MVAEEISEMKRNAIETINYIQSKKISLMKGKQIPKSLTTAEIPVRRGAYVVSVEGEEFTSMGNNHYRDVGFLGRLVGLERHLDGYNLYFTAGNEGWDSRGERVGNPRHILHPLCIDGGFFVPEEGLKVLDGGNLILVSKLGIFSGEGYADLVEEYRNRYMRVYQGYVDLKHKHEELIGQLEAMTEEIQTLKASREDWLYYSAEITSKYHLVYDAYKRFKMQYDGLMSFLEKTTDVDATLRESIKYELASLDKRIIDMLSLFESFKIDESTRAELINVPKITPEYREYIKRKALAKSGIGKVGELEGALEQTSSENDKLKQQLQMAIQMIEQLKQENEQLKQRIGAVEEEVEESEEEGAEEVEEEESDEDNEGDNNNGRGNIMRRILRRG